MSEAREAKPSKGRRPRRRAIDARPTQRRIVSRQRPKEAEE